MTNWVCPWCTSINLIQNTTCQNCEFDRLKLDEIKEKYTKFAPSLQQTLRDAYHWLEKYKQTLNGAYFRTAFRKVSEVHEVLPQIYNLARQEDMPYVLFLFRKLSKRTLDLLSEISTLDPHVPPDRKARAAQASFCDRCLY